MPAYGDIRAMGYFTFKQFILHSVFSECPICLLPNFDQKGASSFSILPFYVLHCCVQGIFAMIRRVV